MRDLLGAGLASLLVLAFAAPAADVAKGQVYLDLNANGGFDSGEPGVAGVGVSNGRDVVQTDAHGNYRIPIAEGDVLFVIKPADYRLPVDARNLPRFHYLHRPRGSPNLQYAGSTATGPLPRALNFGLLKAAPSDRFAIIVMADPQPGTRKEAEFFDRAMRRELHGLPGYRFGITLGDLVFGTLSLFESVAGTAARIGIPWFNVIGNHDINIDALTQEDSDASFQRVFGPSTYSLNEGRVHFIVLNCIIHPSAGNPKYYAGGLTEAQFAFIASDLHFVPEDRLVVVAMHYPLVPIPGRPDDFPGSQRRRLFGLLARYPQTLSLSGHTHFQSQWDAGAAEGWPRVEPHHHFNVGTASGDWWNGVLDDDGIPDATMMDGTPSGYAVVGFDGVKYQIDYKAFGASPGYRMNVEVLPDRSGRALYVNYFLGSNGTRVAFRVDRGEWHPMEKVSEVDPENRRLAQLWTEADPRHRRNAPTGGIPSTHLWKARLQPQPDGSGQNHAIEVRVSDVDGRVFSGEASYRDQ